MTCPEHTHRTQRWPYRYRLTPLGVLHALVGLTLERMDVCGRGQCRGRATHSRLVHWFGWVRR